MDGVDDAVGAEEPHFVAPFFGLARGGVEGVVVVDQVRVEDVGGEGGVEGRVCCEGGEGGHVCGFLGVDGVGWGVWVGRDV